MKRLRLWLSLIFNSQLPFSKCNCKNKSLPIIIWLPDLTIIGFLTLTNMNLSLILFLIGILGFVLNRKNIILMLISIEIMLLAITLLILVSSLGYDDILGQIYAIYIITVAGAESAIGLGILVAFYRLRGSIAIEYK